MAVLECFLTYLAIYAPIIILITLVYFGILRISQGFLIGGIISFVLITLATLSSSSNSTFFKGYSTFMIYLASITVICISLGFIFWPKYITINTEDIAGIIADRNESSGSGSGSPSEEPDNGPKQSCPPNLRHFMSKSVSFPKAEAMFEAEHPDMDEY